MKKIVSSFFILIFNLSLSAQKVNMNLKIYALSNCIQKNYKRIDKKFVFSDVTSSFIFQDLSNLTIEKLNQFDKFINDKTFDYHEELPYKGYEINNANLIIYKCTLFYESKELDKYIRKLIKKEEKKD